MIAAQFAISAFMLAVVMVVFMQNEQVKEASQLFPRSEIYTLGGSTWTASATASTHYGTNSKPCQMSTALHSLRRYHSNRTIRSSTSAAQPGDEAGKFIVHRMDMSPEFLKTYDIPLLAGRNLSRSVANDVRRDESEVAMFWSMK